MERKLYEIVKLKDGREAVIVEVLGSENYIADVGDSPEDWDTIFIKESDIDMIDNILRR